MNGKVLTAFFFASLHYCISVSSDAEPPAIDGSKQPVKLGAIFSASGWAAIGGQVELNATVLAAEDINAQGGILGRPLQVVYEDNRSDLAATVSSFRKLVSADRVHALLGPNWAEFAEVAAPLAEQEGIPMLTASGFSWTLTKNRSFIFTGTPNFNEHVRPLAEFIGRQNHQRIAILHSSSTYFDGIAEALRSALEKEGKRIAEFITVNPKEMDLRSIVLKLQREKIDAIAIFLQEGGDIPTFFRQLRTLRYAPAAYAYDLSYDEVLMKDYSLAEGAVFFQYTGKFDPALKRRYLERFKMEPPWTVPKAYDNVFILKEAIERCGLAPRQVAECLRKIDHQGTAGRTRFGTDGVIIADEPIAVLRTIKEGRIQDLGTKDGV